MPHIDEPIEVTAAPPQLEDEVSIDLTRDSAQLVERDQVETTALDQRDHALRYPGSSGQVRLSRSHVAAGVPGTSHQL
jgi:hypothetical protein